jgi:hypothetical protein
MLATGFMTVVRHYGNKLVCLQMFILCNILEGWEERKERGGKKREEEKEEREERRRGKCKREQNKE